MKKEILLHWFGDNKPSYADWNVENFRKMNPTWEIKYVQFSKDNISENSPDKILQYAIKKAKEDNQLSFAALSDRYRMKYIDQFAGDIIVYFDLDCFPISPLDDFFVFDEKNLTFMTTDIQDGRGYWVNTERSIIGENKQFPIKDIWCLFKVNNRDLQKKIYMRLYVFQQILQCVDLTGRLEYYDQFLINRDAPKQIEKIEKAKEKFNSCQLQIGDSICNKFFTPVEHYHRCERHADNHI